MSQERPSRYSLLEQIPSPRVSLDDIQETGAGDELLEEMYEELESGVSRYFASVIRHEEIAQIQRYRLEPEEYKELHERLDHARRLTHNALCDKLRILARTTGTVGRDASWWSVITGAQEDRGKIGQWALKVEFDRIQQSESEANA